MFFPSGIKEDTINWRDFDTNTPTMSFTYGELGWCQSWATRPFLQGMASTLCWAQESHGTSWSFRSLRWIRVHRDQPEITVHFSTFCRNHTSQIWTSFLVSYMACLLNNLQVLYLTLLNQNGSWQSRKAPALESYTSILQQSFTYYLP